MKTSHSSVGFALIMTLVGTGCGDSERAVVVSVDLTAFDVTAEVDALHIQLVDKTGKYDPEDTFVLEEGQTEPDLTLVVGARTPEELTLVAYALRGAQLVAQSPPKTLRFGDGVTYTTVTIEP